LRVEPALVVERVDAHHGQVKIGGELWSARSYDGHAVIEPGRNVDVMSIEGATAYVFDIDRQIDSGTA
jgi:membrane protein implicated in regulation of membrane protease activity